MRDSIATAAVVLLTLAACASDDGEPVGEARAREGAAATEAAREAILVSGPREDRLSADDIARGRRDPSWRRVVQLDTADTGTPSGSESWDDISAETVNRSATVLPIQGEAEGPSVLKAQILLDRVLFSPGAIDGYWGKNTEKAVYWLQKREGLAATGRIDRATFERLTEMAGGASQLVRAHQLTASDVEGPFVSIPDDIYEKAEMECMCYESLTEKLAETFHTTPEILRKLNPGVDLDAVTAGRSLQVPAVRSAKPGGGAKIARLVISDGGFYVHAVDADGRVVHHFPATLGSDYAPSPSGDFSVTAIAPDPTWHYQPGLLTGVPDHEEDAVIPPGPNNAVGVVWMQLSKPHYGIHGTSTPETIGYATSHGCVRLTNWDARFLSESIDKGVPVEFRDVDNRESESAS